MMSLLDLTPWRVKKLPDGSAAYLVPDAKITTDDKKLCAHVIVSTPTMDRERDIMVPTGCRTKSHEKNPIVLLNHQKNQPGIALARSPDGEYTLKTYEDRIESRNWFDPNEKLSMQSYGLVKSGALGGVSPGFLTVPGCVHKVKAADGHPAYVYSEWDLVEISHVPIGMNPDAIVLALEKGFDGQQLLPELKELLLPFKPEPKAQVTSGWEEKSADGLVYGTAVGDDFADEIDLSDAEAVPLTESTRFFHATYHKALDTVGMVQELRGILESQRTKAVGGKILDHLGAVLELCKSGHAGHIAEFPDQPGLPGEPGDDIAQKDMKAWRETSAVTWEKFKADMAVAVATECVGAVKETADFLKVIAGNPAHSTSLRAAARNHMRKLERVKMVSAPADDEESEAWGQVALKLDAWSKPVGAGA